VLVLGVTADIVPLGATVEVVEMDVITVVVCVCGEVDGFMLLFLFLFANTPPVAPPAAAAMTKSAIKAKTSQKVVFRRPQILLSSVPVAWRDSEVVEGKLDPLTSSVLGNQSRSLGAESRGNAVKVYIGSFSGCECLRACPGVWTWRPSESIGAGGPG